MHSKKGPIIFSEVFEQNALNGCSDRIQEECSLEKQVLEGEVNLSTNLEGCAVYTITTGTRPTQTVTTKPWINFLKRLEKLLLLIIL